LLKTHLIDKASGNAMNADKFDLSGQKKIENENELISDGSIIQFNDEAHANKNRRESGSLLLTSAYQSWLELLKSPTIGPFHAYAQGFFFALEDVLKIAEKGTKLQGDINEFLIQTNKASLDAINLVYKKSPNNQYETKEDFEELRKIVIDAFEECFTRLFESKEFAELWNRLFINQSELVKLIQDSFVERNLKMLNLPTRDEFDSVLKDVHDLKRIIHDLKNAVRPTGVTHSP
jgi:hypothetical protein